MKIGRFTTMMVTVCAAISLSACGKGKEKEITPEQEGNQKVAAINKTAEELRATYNINLGQVDSDQAVKDYPWSSLTEAQRKDVRAKLNLQIKNVDRVSQIAQHHRMSGNRAGLDIIRSNADKYLTALNKHESKSGDGSIPASRRRRAERPEQNPVVQAANLDNQVKCKDGARIISWQSLTESLDKQKIGGYSKKNEIFVLRLNDVIENVNWDADGDQMQIQIQNGLVTNTPDRSLPYASLTLYSKRTLDRTSFVKNGGFSENRIQPGIYIINDRGNVSNFGFTVGKPESYKGSVTVSLTGRHFGDREMQGAGDADDGSMHGGPISHIVVELSHIYSGALEDVELNVENLKKIFGRGIQVDKLTLDKDEGGWLASQNCFQALRQHYAPRGGARRDELPLLQ